jgi:hypothetical protein
MWSHKCKSKTQTFCVSVLYESEHDDGNDDDVDDGVRLRFWAAARKWSTVHPRGDIWAWRTMVEWCRDYLLIRPPGFSDNPTSSHLLANQEELGEINDESGLLNIFVHISKWLFICLKILRLGTYGFTSPEKEGVLRTFIALKIYLLGRIWIREPWI